MTAEFNPIFHATPEVDLAAIKDLAWQQFYDLPGAVRIGTDYAATAVEIGSWAGGTTLLLADMGYRVFAVDTWMGSAELADLAALHGQVGLFVRFCENMRERLFRNVFPLQGLSLVWAQAWPRSLPIDFLFIDGAHDYWHCLRDITMWSPHVRSGGIICGHDYEPQQFPDVVRAVRETGPFEVKGASVWWRRKPCSSTS